MSFGLKQIILALPLLFLSCEKPERELPVLPPDTNSEGYLDTLWTVPMIPSQPNRVCSSSQIYLYDEKIYYADVKCQNKLRALDSNGNQVWVSNHAIFTEDMYLRRKAIQDDNWLYFIYNQVIYKLDLNTDALTALYTVPQHLFVWKLVKHDEEIFMSVKKARFDNDWVALMSVDVNTANLDTVWSNSRTDDMIPHLVTPQIETNNGEDFAYLTVNYFQDGNPTNQFADLFCYNLTKDQLIWKADSFEVARTSISTSPPIVNGNVVVKMGYRTIHGFDKATGDILWTYHSPDDDGHFATGFIANYGSNVVAKADNDHFISIRASSGSVNYDLEDRGYTPSWKYYIIDGVIYYVAVGDARFVALRLADGKKLMYLKNPPIKTINEYADITDWFAIDEETRTGYVHDYSRISAFKIPEF